MRLTADQIQALVVDSSGRPRHQLHVKLKEELGFAQVASYADLEESKRACMRFEGPTLVLLFLPESREQYSNFMRFYQRGANKPVEVAILAAPNVSENIRQEFLNLRAAAFQRIHDQLEAVAVARSIVEDPRRFRMPDEPSPQSASNAFKLSSPASDPEESQTASDEARRRAARLAREASPRESAPRPIQPAPEVLPFGGPRPPFHLGADAPTVANNRKPGNPFALSGGGIRGPQLDPAFAETSASLDAITESSATLRAINRPSQKPVASLKKKGIPLFAIGLGSGLLLAGIAAAAFFLRDGSASAQNSPPPALNSAGPTPSALLVPAPTPAARTSLRAPLPKPDSKEIASAPEDAFDPFAGLPPEPVEIASAASSSIQGNAATVEEIRRNKSAWLGKVVSVEGVVSFGGGGFVAERRQFLFQDATGGLLVDDPQGRGGPAAPQTGNRARVSGRVEEHKGMLQLVPESPTAILSDSGNEPTPQSLKPEQFGESFEGMLVRVEGVRLRSNIESRIPRFKVPNDKGKNIVADVAGGNPVEFYLHPDANIFGFDPPGLFILQGILYHWGPPGQEMRWIVYPRGKSDFIF